jgi:hypothetical protein
MSSQNFYRSSKGEEEEDDLDPTVAWVSGRVAPVNPPVANAACETALKAQAISTGQTRSQND